MNDEFIRKEDFCPVEREKTATRRSVWSYAPGVVMFLLLVAISSFSTLVQFDFDINEIVWSSFLLSALLRMVSMFCSKWVGADTRYKRDEYGTEMCRVRDAFMEMSQKLEPAEFEAWVLAQNTKAKMDAAKDAADDAAEKLRNRCNRLAYKQVRRYSRRRAKRIEAIKQRIAEAEAKATYDYIFENIGRIKVKYMEMHAEDFLSAKAFSSDNRALTVDYMRANTAAVARGLPSMFLSMLISSVFAVSYTIGTLNVISLCTDLFMIVLNYGIGWAYVGNATSAKVVDAYNRRKIVLCRYFAEENE